MEGARVRFLVASALTHELMEITTPRRRHHREGDVRLWEAAGQMSRRQRGDQHRHGQVRSSPSHNTRPRCHRRAHLSSCSQICVCVSFRLDLRVCSLQGPFFAPAFNRLARGGRHVVFGAAHMTPPGERPNWIRLVWQWLLRPSVDPLEIIAQNRSVMGFNLIW